MHHSHYSKALPGQLHVAPIECTFLHYQAGRLDGIVIGYRQGVADMAESNAVRAEHSARMFYAMTAEDADWCTLTQAISAAADVAQARREAADWAARHCTYAGGPVDFLTGEPVGAGAATK